MGLAICRKILVNSGGEMKVFSHGVGQGYTYAFSMNMKLPELISQNHEYNHTSGCQSMSILDLLDRSSNTQKIKFTTDKAQSQLLQEEDAADLCEGKFTKRDINTIQNKDSESDLSVGFDDFDEIERIPQIPMNS